MSVNKYNLIEKYSNSNFNFLNILGIYYELQIMQASISLLQKYISWLNNSEGIAISDKLLLFFIKLIYISLRITLLVLGKKRRNRLIVKRGLDFGTLWKNNFNIWKRGKKDSVLLKFKMPKYDYEFYCRNNNDDFKIMTFHEDDIMEHNFTAKEGDIVVDIGAHIGPYTLIAHNILFKSKNLSLLIEVHLLDLEKNISTYENVMALLKQYNFKLKLEKMIMVKDISF